MEWWRLGTARFAVCHWTANLTAQSPSCETNAMCDSSPAFLAAQMWAWHLLTKLQEVRQPAKTYMELTIYAFAFVLLALFAVSIRCF